MKIINTTWFSANFGVVGVQCIGIVVIENEVGEKKAYVGIADGQDEGLDAKKIAEYGAPIMKESLKEILNKLE